MGAVDVGAGHLISLPLLAFVGLFVGYIAGMFGVGGGILLMPVLLYVFRVPETVAVGSSLCQQCGTSLASFLKYRHLKRGEPRIDLLMIGGSLIGVDAGGRALDYFSRLAKWQLEGGHPVPAVRVVLDVGYAGLLTFTAWFTFREAWLARKRDIPRGDTSIPGPLVTLVRIPPFVDLPKVQLKQVSVPMIAAVGFALGFFSGLMGLGGGILFMPIMLYGFGLSLRNAAGTGVLLLFVTVVWGTIDKAWHTPENVNLSLAMAILIGSSIGSQLGALTTHYLPNRTLRLIFAGLVAFTALVVASDLIRILR